MENIALGQEATALAFIVGIIGSIEYLLVRLRKWLKSTLKEEIDPIKNRLNDIEIGADKNFLTNFLAKVERGDPIDEVEWERFWETYRRYHQLGGNSYIDHKVQKLGLKEV